MIVAAPGNELICSDFSNIEGRVLAWLAGEDWKIQAFKDYDNGTGADLYVLSYAKSFGVTLEEALPHRQIGKVQELALGYQGGVGAFQTMAKTYRVTVSDERADELKVFWRNAHPNVVQYWYDLEDGAIAAVHNPRTKFTVGAKGSEVIFLKNGSFLWCRLPSGRALCYPYPKVIPIMTPWGAEKEALSYMTVVDDSTRRKGNTISDPNSSGSWQRISTYGGSLAENVTQAVARDLLSEALLRLEEKNIPTIMHVHDEVVVEVPKGTVTLSEVENVMAVVPAWARGLPLASAGWCGERYRKD
jgi:DNA polymerase